MKRLVRQFVATLVYAAGLTQGVRGQSFSYGSPSELAGVLWIFVDTGNDLDVRENILKHIQKELPFLRIAGEPEEADAVLVFGANAYSRYYGTRGNSTTNATANCAGSATRAGNYAYGQANCQGSSRTNSSSVPIYGTVVEGKGWVIKLIPQGRPRLLLEFADTRSTILERRPSSNFARNFVKEYRKVNPEPPAMRPTKRMPGSTAAPVSSPVAPGPSPEETLFVDKARGVLARLADSLGLGGEWRALLTRRAAPTLEKLFEVDSRASTSEMADASQAAVGEVGRMLGVARTRLGPLTGDLLKKLGPVVDTQYVRALFRDAGAMFLEATPDPSHEDVRRFMTSCAEKFPSLLAQGRPSN